MTISASFKFLYLGICALVLFPPIANAQDNLHCDPDILASVRNPNHYKARNTDNQDRDRCEGIYAQQVGSTLLQVVSFTEFFDEFNPFSDNQLQLSWIPFDKSKTKIRSMGIKKNLFYRMDTTRPTNEQQFIWPTDILFAQDIHREDLGVSAWTQQVLAGQTIDVYLPLKVYRDKLPESNSTYQLLILPGQELKEVYTSLAPIGKDGRRGDFLYDSEPLNEGPYPASRTIDLLISHDHLSSEGVYYLEVSAEMRKRGVEERIVVYFYHPVGNGR